MKRFQVVGLAIVVGLIALSATSGVASAGSLATNKNCNTVAGGAYCTGIGYTRSPAVQVYSRFTTTNGAGVLHCSAFDEYSFNSLQQCSSGQYAYSKCITPGTTIHPKGHNNSANPHAYSIQLYTGSSGQTGC